MSVWIAQLIRDDRGQDLIEYALLLAMISVGIVGAMNALGVTVEARYRGAADVLDRAGGAFSRSGGSSGVVQWPSSPSH